MPSWTISGGAYLISSGTLELSSRDQSVLKEHLIQSLLKKERKWDLKREWPWGWGLRYDSQRGNKTPSGRAKTPGQLPWNSTAIQIGTEMEAMECRQLSFYYFILFSLTSDSKGKIKWVQSIKLINMAIWDSCPILLSLQI